MYMQIQKLKTIKSPMNRLLRDLNYTKLDRDLFNTTVGEYGIDFWRSVVLMHYFLSFYILYYNLLFMKNKKKGIKMNTKKELGNKYYNLLSDVTSYTNDKSSMEFALEYILKTYVPVKVLKVWIARAEEELKQHEQNEEKQ